MSTLLISTIRGKGGQTPLDPPESSANGGLSARQSRPVDSPARLWGASLPDRLAWVRRFRRKIASNSDTVVALICAEVGKSPWEAFSGDVLPLLSACRWHERNAHAILSERRVGGQPLWMIGHNLRTLRAPLGRVAIIATWNYPVQLLGVQLVQALVGGNAVVVKPSERSPRTQRYLLELAWAAGAPDSILQTRDHRREAGQRMLEEERFDHIVFTGSTRIGRCIAAMAAETLTPTTLELSGSDSAFVLDDADPILAARCIWHAVAMNAGQTCVAPRRALVHARLYSRFIAELAPLVAGARPANVIDECAAGLLETLVQNTLAMGGRTLSGVLEPIRGRSIRPIVIVDCPPDAPLAVEEHFGPALAVVPCETEAEMLRIHAKVGQVLATSVFTSNRARGMSLASRLGSGTVTINDTVLPTAHPAAPIAGRGPSGWGITRGREGLLAMTRSVHVSSTSARVRIPPLVPPARTASRLRRLLLWWYGGSASAPRIAPAAGIEAPAPAISARRAEIGNAPQAQSSRPA